MPYLEVVKDNESEEDKIQSVEVPNIVGMSITDAKKILKDMGLEINVNNDIEGLDKDNTIIKSQVPNLGVKVNQGSKIYVEY